MLCSFMGLSSAATRLELSFPQRLQRWMMAHSPPLRTQTATGSHDAAAGIHSKADLVFLYKQSVIIDSADDFTAIIKDIFSHHRPIRDTIQI